MNKAGEAVREALRGYFYPTVDIGKPPEQLFDEISEIAANAAIESLFPKDVVVACRKWNTNADIIHDAWKLGHVKGEVYDMTPGDAGALWSRRLWLGGGDLGVPRVPLDGIDIIAGNETKTDFRRLPWPDGKWDTTFFDPPYKLNGNPNGLAELSQRYGVDIPATPEQRHTLMADGLIEAIRITKPGGHVLMKCQDQVANNRIYWQTRMMTNVAESGVLSGDEGSNLYEFAPKAKLVERFDMIGHYIPQPMGPSERYPNGRTQKHAHARPSTLLIFQVQETS